MNTKIKSLGYIRVSTGRQEDGTSLESQTDYLNRYAELNNIEYTEIIVDGGKSAFKNAQKRLGFKKLIEAVRNKQTEAVVTYSLSRFTRNTRELLESIDLMKANNVQYHSVKERIDTSSSMGMFFVTIIGAIAQLESGQTGERIKDTKASNKIAGRTYSSPVYGYQNDLTNHTLIPIPSEIAVVNQIKQLRSIGTSYDKIAKQLNLAQVPTKSDGKWYASTVMNVCTNSIYK